MEDNSYVNLSLEKYNELYDKAKAYDEIIEKLMEINEESAATEEVVEEVDSEIKVGDKVKIIKPTYGALQGVIGEVSYKDEDGDIGVVDNDGDTWTTRIDSVKKVNEGEEN